MTYPELSREPAILADKRLLKEYVALREAGNPHGFAAMLVLQSPPACRTDNTFFDGRGTLEDQLGEQGAKTAAEVAQMHGYRPNVRDVYEPGLARFQYDPQAFVPATGGRGHVKKVLESRGYRVNRDIGHGSGVAVENIPQPTAPTVSLAEDLVQENTVKLLHKEPHLKRLKKQELREVVIERHGKPSKQLRS